MKTGVCMCLCVCMCVCVLVLLHRKFHQVCVHEEPQQEVVNILEFLRSSHVQHQDPGFRFPVERKMFKIEYKQNKTK